MSTTHEMIKEYQKYLLACDKAFDTIKKYTEDLKRFIDRFECDFRFVKPEMIIEYISEKNLSPVTHHMRYTSLKGFYQWMIDNDKIIINPMMKIPVPRLSKRLPSRIMTIKETMTMLAAVPADKSQPFQYRNRLIMELLYSCSLRRKELISLNLDDYDPSTKSLRIRGSTTKNRGGRILPVGKVASEMLETYIGEIREPSANKAIFLNRYGVRLVPAFVTYLVKEVREQVGIKTQATSHSYRKSSGTHMLRNGGSLIYVSRLLGHTDITATELYTKVYPQDLIKMHRKYHPRERNKSYRLPKLKVPNLIFEGKKRRSEFRKDREMMPEMKTSQNEHHPRRDFKCVELPKLEIPKFIDHMTPLIEFPIK